MTALSLKPPKDQEPRPVVLVGDHPWAPPCFPGPSPRLMTQGHTPPSSWGPSKEAQGDTTDKEKPRCTGWGRKAFPSGPGPHHTSSRSVRALGLSRYFSRARQAEMRSGLSSILSGRGERVYLGNTHLGFLGLPYFPHLSGVLREGLDALRHGTHPALPGLT